MEESELQPWIVYLVTLLARYEDKKKTSAEMQDFRRTLYLQKPLVDMLHQNVE